MVSTPISLATTTLNKPIGPDSDHRRFVILDATPPPNPAGDVPAELVGVDLVKGFIGRDDEKKRAWFRV